ncbi:endonuclease/exonuclease/phosphatase family protein [Georgenia wangjunii]|uniref:endonuclease/exonuclease/phosphatase family protein n=1 Tax=Georgenia wangjunii TaxID=3117730 RepID=UPI002F26810E
MSALRVLTLNLQHGRSADRDAHAPDAASLAAALAGLEADVVALQEVDKGQARSSRVDQTRVVAEALGMPWARFAAEFAGNERGLRRRPRPAHVPDGSGYGVALLSRYPVTSWHVRPLRPGPMRVPRRTGAGWGVAGRYVRVDPARVCLAAVLATPAGPLSVAVTHLSVDVPTARRQLAESAWALRTLPGPHVLLGDLNLTGPDAEAATGMSRLAVADTFTARRPRRQIDHVLGGPGVRAAGPAEVRRLAISDHLALAVGLHLG